MRTAILHIGPPKTGSTSIQRFLTASRQALLDRGYLVPRFAGKRNHISLAALGAREDYGGNAMRRAGTTDDQALASRLARDLAEEMAQQPDSVHTAVFSSEQLAVRVKDRDGVARLRDLLEPYFDRFRVIAYLRRQDELAVSRYSTGLRAGGETAANIFPAEDDEGGVYHLDQILDRYAAVFGQDAVQPRIFDRSLLVAGDVVTDFLRAIGVIDLTPDAEGARNPSLRAAVQELMRRYNERVAARGLEDRPRLGPMLRDERYWGRGRIPPRAAAEAFLARFAEGNERVRSIWFPDRPSLFSQDFSRYPEIEAVEPIADGLVLDAALDVLVDLGAEMQGAEVERRMALGQVAVAEQRHAEARSHFTRVLRAVHDHRGAAKALRDLDALEGLAQLKTRKRDRKRAQPGSDGTGGREGGDTDGTRARKGAATDGEGTSRTSRDERKARREAKGERGAKRDRDAPQDQPERRRQGREDRPERNREGRADRPERKREGREDRPERKREGREDRPERKREGREDRPERRREAREDRPKHDRDGPGNRPRHAGDMVTATPERDAD